MNKIKKFNFAISILLIACFTAAAPGIQDIIGHINAWGARGRSVYGIGDNNQLADLIAINEAGNVGKIGIHTVEGLVVFEVKREGSCERPCSPECCCIGYVVSVVGEKSPNGLMLQNSRFDGADKAAEAIIYVIFGEFLNVTNKIGIANNRFWTDRNLEVISELVCPGGWNVIKVGKGDFVMYTIAVDRGLNFVCWKSNCDLAGFLIIKFNNLKEEVANEELLVDPGYIAHRDWKILNECARLVGVVVFGSKCERDLVLSKLEVMRPDLVEAVKKEILLFRKSRFEVLISNGLSDVQYRELMRACMNEILESFCLRISGIHPAKSIHTLL